MRVPFRKVASVGVIKDIPDWQCPPHAWTRAENVRFREGSAWKAYGYEKALHPPTVAPHFVSGLKRGNDRWWIYLGLQKAYGVLAGTHYNLTRQSAGLDVNYTGAQENRWNTTVLQGVPIFNNGVDLPQQWLPVGSGQRLVNLANWDSTDRAKVMRSFKEYLIALDVTKSGVSYPQMVKWSHPAEPGTVPTSWDETDETKDAGEHNLSATDDWVIDCLPMGDVNLVYKQETVWGMSFIGGVNVFRFFPIFNDFGMLTQSCAAHVGRRHFVVTTDDVVLHDGQSWESVLDNRVRRYLFNDIDPSNYVNSFVVDRVSGREIWFCYPTNGAVYPNKALVWNRFDNAPSFRDLPGVREGKLSFTPAASGADDTWEADTVTWEQDELPWELGLQAAVDKTIILPVPDSTKLIRLDRTYQDDGVNIVSTLERTAMQFDAGDVSLDLNNSRTVKQILGVYPYFDGTQSYPIQVQLGYSNKVDAPVTWRPAQVFIPGVTEKIDSTISGRFLSIRFISQDNDFWKLTGFDVDVRVVGEF